MSYPAETEYVSPRWPVIAMIAAVVAVPFAFTQSFTSYTTATDWVRAIAAIGFCLALLVLVIRNRDQLKGGVLFTLTPAGIRLANGALIRWRDVGEVGSFRVGLTKYVGVQLATYRSLLQSTTAEHLGEIAADARAARRVGFVSTPGVVEDPDHYLREILRGEPKSLVSPATLSAPQKQAAAALAHCRRTYGWELAFSAINLGRGTTAVMAEIEAYRKAARHGS